LPKNYSALSREVEELEEEEGGKGVGNCNEPISACMLLLKPGAIFLAPAILMAIELLGKSKDDLTALCAELGEPAYRGAQLYHALYVQRIFDVTQMSTLPAGLRERLANETRVTLPIVRQRYVSQDGSVRYLLALPGSEPSKKDEFANEDSESAEKTRPARPASVEAVFMPSEGRQTICISTQAGCAVDCQFCLTAQLGLIRNLTPGEIVAQVLQPLEEHKAALTPNTNIVLMGQGEPLLNFEPVMAALRILLDPKGVAISPKHATLSTSGIVPGIERLAKEEVRPHLAISLNASNDEQRNTLMPINRKYPLATLMKACREYPLRSWEYLMFEYVMLGGVNDSLADARRVAKLLAPLKAAKVNLIPWNPGQLPYHESTVEDIDLFQKLLIERGIPTFVRHSRGRDVMAACGQLALNEISGSPLAVLP
jgi:23S rRNA (adenine2503-C2)-methyltransferase